MGLISTKEASEKWGISQRRIVCLAGEGRIPGAKQYGKNWLIPDDAQKPQDGRMRNAKEAAPAEVPFRFPLLIDFEEKEYFPPLNEEEKILRRAELSMHACRFDDAKKDFLDLFQHTKNRYIYIAVLYFLCYVSIYDNTLSFNDMFQAYNKAMAEDFPYKREMMLTRYEFEASFGYYKGVLDDFCIDPNYSYHPSAYPSLLLISILPIENGNFSLLSKIRYDTYEMLCQEMEHYGYFCEAQELHYLLLIVYQLQGNREKMHFHIRRGLEIAMEKEFYWNAVIYQSFYPDATEEVLKEFPTDFTKKITSLGSMLGAKYAAFEKAHQNPSFLGLLSNKEYKYAFLANQGYSNREIADKLKISEKLVAKKFSEIYETLGLKGRRSLIDLINNTHKSGKI